MSTLAIVMLGFLIALLLIVLLTVWSVDLVVRRTVGDKHRVIQSIIETRQVPTAWLPRSARMAKSAADLPNASPNQQQAKDAYLKRLDGLIAYARTSSLVADEEARQMLLDELAAVRAEWQANIH